MKTAKAILLLVTLLSSSVHAAASARSVYLNGVDISSAKNQQMQQVNISIDTNGNIYIEAPHYEAQQESTFVPLGRKSLIPGRTPLHKSPGPLPTTESPGQTQAELASPAESGDTKEDGEELKEKEGTRFPTHDTNNPSATTPGDTQGNPAAR